MRVKSSEERGFDIKDVAKHLGVNRNSVCRWIDEKDFPAYRVGQLFRLTISEVAAWVMKGGGDGGEARRTEKKREGG
jgi:excisionase family DNA binding protein